MTPPYWRGDVLIPADLVEEIARVVGYDRVRAEVPPVQPQAIDSAEFERENELATTLAALGYTEFLTLSLQPGSVAAAWREHGLAVPAPVEITNPLSEDQRWMRFSLAPALLAGAARDRAVRPYRVFELGHVFADAQPAPQETVELTALHAGGAEAFGRLKSDVLALLRRVTGADARVERGTYASLHPGKTAALRVGETLVGYVGVVDPRLARAYDVARGHGAGDAVRRRTAAQGGAHVRRALEVPAGRPRSGRRRAARGAGGRAQRRGPGRAAGAQRDRVRRVPRPAGRRGQEVARAARSCCRATRRR